MFSLPLTEKLDGEAVCTLWTPYNKQHVWGSIYISAGFICFTSRVSHPGAEIAPTASDQISPYSGYRPFPGDQNRSTVLLDYHSCDFNLMLSLSVLFYFGDGSGSEPRQPCHSDAGDQRRREDRQLVKQRPSKCDSADDSRQGRPSSSTSTKVFKRLTKMSLDSLLFDLLLF